MSYTCPSAIGDLVLDAEVRRLTLHADQSERLMSDALRQGRVEAACRYHRYASASCATLMDLLTA